MPADPLGIPEVIETRSSAPLHIIEFVFGVEPLPIDKLEVLI
jgi:hypothetical protein